MGVIRNCLTMVGLFVFLVIGGCVAGLRGCAPTYNPTVFSEHVDETPDKARRMLSDYFQSATFEVDPVVDGQPAKVAVQDFTDGSIHLTMDGRGKRLVEVVARVTPADEDSRVEVVSDATQLAAAIDAPEARLHRHIKSEIVRALDAIDHHQPLPSGFSAARLIKAAERNRG